jgi:signal peptide peptidase SppA
MKMMFLPLHYALIQPQHWAAACARVEKLDQRLAKADDDDDEDEEYQPWWKQYDIWGEKLPAPTRAGSTEIIPIKGVITSGLPAIYRAIGYADTNEISGWVKAAAADNSVHRILLSIDSPGGFVSGTPELAAEVDAATARKRVVSHTSGMMDSAAYWVGSQAHEVYCTPSADVGCIGVYQVHYDYSALLQRFGIKAEMIKDGDLKAAGHPDFPLTADQRQHLQDEVNEIGTQFRTAVKAKRTMVDDDSMRGQSFLGTVAAARHLVGGLRSLDSLI